MAGQNVDVAILTVIPIELTAAWAALSVSAGTRKKDRDETIFYRGVIHSRLKEQDYQFVLTCIGAAGNPDTSTATSEIIQKYRPRVALLMGIAAGMRGQVKIGEIVLAERIVAYEPAALVQDPNGTSKEELRPDITRLHQGMLQDLVNYVADEENTERIMAVFEQIGGRFPQPPQSEEDEYREHVAQEITTRMSTIASGEKLLRDPTKLHVIRETIHGKVEVGEMEAAGFVSACSRFDVPWLVIRGISDFGDSLKNDQFHRFASYAAAAGLEDFLAYGLDLAERTSDSHQGDSGSSPPLAGRDIIGSTIIIGSHNRITRGTDQE